MRTEQPDSVQILGILLGSNVMYTRGDTNTKYSLHHFSGISGAHYFKPFQLSVYVLYDITTYKYY